MGGRDARHGSRLAFWLPVLLVLGVLVAAATAYVLVEPTDPADPSTDPAAVAPPETLELPPVTAPAPVAGAAALGPLDPAKVRRALAPLLDDADLGPHVLATVAGLDGSPLYSRGNGAAIPASTLKLLTSAAALETLGPDHTFATTVVADGPHRVVIVGGGDPLLDAADLSRLARTTAAALDAAKVRVTYDISLFTGPEVSPHWPASYVSDGVVAPIQALWVDEGRPPSGIGRVEDPAAAAAVVFAAALDKAGVEVIGIPEPGRARAGAAEIARVTSASLSQLVEHTLETSDNEAAEVLGHHVGLATVGKGSFAGGAQGVVETLDGLGVPTTGAEVYDGSGLSRDNLLDPDTLADLLEVAGSPAHPYLRATLTGLPVAGFTGSLTDRFVDETGLGFVRAKTGTLTGVSGLAGTVTDAAGRPMVFALLADEIALLDTLDAREALDAASSALAACLCG